MSRSELAVTIAGLFATYFLPWPQNDAALERRPALTAHALESGRACVPLVFYGSFGRVRTGSPEGIQPTR
jgi:hypothetical protein